MSYRFDYSKESKEDLIEYAKRVEWALVKTPLGGFLFKHGELFTLKERAKLMRVIGQEIELLKKNCQPMPQPTVPEKRCYLRWLKRFLK